MAAADGGGALDAAQIDDGDPAEYDEADGIAGDDAAPPPPPRRRAVSICELHWHVLVGLAPVLVALEVALARSARPPVAHGLVERLVGRAPRAEVGLAAALLLGVGGRRRGEEEEERQDRHRSRKVTPFYPTCTPPFQN